MIICSLLGYIAVEFPEWGYTGIALFCLLGAVVIVVTGGINVVETGKLMYIYSTVVVLAYEVIIARKAFKILERLEPANKARNSDA